MSRAAENLNLPDDHWSCRNWSGTTAERMQALAWLVMSEVGRASPTNAWVAEKLPMGHIANGSRAVKRIRENDDQEARRLRKKLEVDSR